MLPVIHKIDYVLSKGKKVVHPALSDGCVAREQICKKPSSINRVDHPLFFDDSAILAEDESGNIWSVVGTKKPSQAVPKKPTVCHSQDIVPDHSTDELISLHEAHIKVARILYGSEPTLEDESQRIIMDALISGVLEGFIVDREARRSRLPTGYWVANGHDTVSKGEMNAFFYGRILPKKNDELHCFKKRAFAGWLTKMQKDRPKSGAGRPNKTDAAIDEYNQRLADSSRESNWQAETKYLSEKHGVAQGTIKKSITESVFNSNIALGKKSKSSKR